MKIIGYCIDYKSGIYTSEGEQSKDFDFVLKDYGKDAIRIMSCMDYDVANLLRIFNIKPDEAQRLVKGNLYAPPYRLKYYGRPGKFFCAEKGFGYEKQYSNFCDASQYDNKLREIKDDHSPEYGFARANKAKQIGEEVYSAFKKLGYKPESLISPTNVFRKSVLSELSLPKRADVPPEAEIIAYDCCRGNWLEAYQRGYFPKVNDYDLSSAYPFQASQLYDLRRGEWLQSPEYKSSAYYGYCRCEVYIDSEFSPILHQIDGQNFTPTGVRETCLTKAQIDFINNYKLGYVTIIDGWWWIPKGTQYQPLKGIINYLYERKKASCGMEREIIKRIMSGSFYGLFIELQNDGNKTGEYFLSPYAAEIETRTQLKIAETCLVNNIKPIHIAVDGIITDKTIPTPNPDGIGEWRLAYQGKCIIVSTGVVVIEGKFGEGEFGINYNWLENEINTNPDKSEYTLSKHSVMTLPRAINEKRLAELGDIVPMTRIINIPHETKRQYDDAPLTGEDIISHVYKSKAWSIDMLNILTDRRDTSEITS